MKIRKALSLLLSLVLLCTMALPVMTAYADDGSSNNGMKFTKKVKPNGDDSYTIRLEAYATGSKITSVVKKDIPTDVVLVLDQSGSMSDNFSTTTEDSWVSYGKQTNSVNYDLRMNNSSSNATKNLYYKLSDVSYVEVSVDRTQGELVQDYVEITDARNVSLYYAGYTLYAKTEEGYKEVIITRSWNGYTYTYTYTLNDGTTVERTSNRQNGNPPYTIYRLQDTYKYIYEYYYTVNGVRTTIGTESEGDDTVFDVEFYEKQASGTGITALQALKNSVRNFASAVENKAAGEDGILGTDDDINHRIAVVGYASNGEYYNDSKYENTEVFVGATQYNYNVDAKQYYGSAFQNMNTPEGQANIRASIGALSANGATYTDYGMEMANGILDAYPVSSGEQRNRVIILFTDGFPGYNSNNFNSTAANTAISHAATAKGNGVTVYTVGIFSGADATSAGNKNGNNTQKANWFMQQVSSNNGKPQDPSYYLSAANASALNNIFQQISSNIENGSTSVTLDEKSVIKDIVTPYFDIPDGATGVTLKTADYTAENTFTNEVAAPETVTAGIKDNTLSVSGFSFKDNWCGEEYGKYHGKKLIIEFTVKPKEGFLGGNGVPTNESAGIYENAEATEPVASATVNPVDVQIKNVVIESIDTNVYLGAQYGAIVNGSEIKNNMTLTIGGVNVNLTKPAPNYGLEDWQKEYVKIEVKITDINGQEVQSFEMLDDQQYKVTVTVKPTKTGTATEKTGEDNGIIHVFTPELTFKDSKVSYMASIVDYDYNNEDYVETKWRHQDAGDETPKYSTDPEVTMLGKAPNLTYEYTPDATRLIEDKKVKATDYVPVAVKVKLGETDVTNKTTFVHQCDVKPEDTCEWAQVGSVNGNPAFLLHVKDVYADLTITKSGADTDADPGQSFLFTVTGPDNYSTEVIIVGNGSVTLKNLKIGTYTVREDTSWSWRYTPTTDKPQTITLEANEKNEVTIINTRKKDQWLDGNVRTDNKFTGAAATTD